MAFYGFTPDTPLGENYGMHHSAKMRIRERMRKTKDDELEIETTVEDPVALEKLWTVKRIYAHHSFSLFQMRSTETITGKVVEFHWTNPHTWTWVDVTNKNGSVVKIVLHPLKSGKPGGEFVRATLPDGTVKVMFPEK